MKVMKALIIGTYDLNTYTRGKVLINGLRKNDVDVKVFLKTDKFKYLNRNYLN